MSSYITKNPKSYKEFSKIKIERIIAQLYSYIWI